MSDRPVRLNPEAAAMLRVGNTWWAKAMDALVIATFAAFMITFSYFVIREVTLMLR